MYAVFDIETTGGAHLEEGITDIAIYRFNGQEVTDQFISLVNPERAIHPYVQMLTGINQHTVRTAPKFHEVAKRIVEITEDCVLVAHNAPFDYNILKNEFRRLGYAYKRKTLCTVDLSRKLMPGKEAYRLDALARSLGIPITQRHRANGDALATLQLFKILAAKDTSKIILKKAIREDKPPTAKPHLLPVIENLPTQPGVYYLHQRNGDLIYIGKAKNIRAKVTNHFTGSSRMALVLQKRTASITHEETGTELIAALKAQQEIQKNKPFYNFRNFETSVRSPDFKYPYENMLLVDKGRDADERSVLLIEKNTCRGFGFFNLNYQLNHIDILRSIITPIEPSRDADALVGWYLQKNKHARVIPF